MNNGLLVLNDIHIGVNRTGGTTPESLMALRAYLQERFRFQLKRSNRVIINGDFFDSYNVPLSEVLQAYRTIDGWLFESTNSITLVPGNHCLSKSSYVLSSFELLAQLLHSQYPNQVRYLQGGRLVDDRVYVISHMPNQALFEAELAKVPEQVDYLLLHANLDNAFACEKDHSLNLTRKQAKAFKDQDITVVLGHEHQGREILGGSVIVVGNQFPNSVSDCIPHGDGQKAGTKRCMLIKDSGHEFIHTWSVTDDVGGFMRVLWSSLENYDETFQGFVRVEGEATADQAPEVIRAISNFRQKSKAFVVANAVKVETLDDLSDIADSVEDVRSVDVVELLLAELSEEQQATIRKLIGEQK